MAIATGAQILAADMIHLTQVIRKTADETVNNSTALQNDDELLLPILANEIWEFEVLIIAESSAAADIKTAITVPAGATLKSIGIGRDQANATITASSTAAWTAENINGIITILKGIVINGANAGNVTLQWAQQAAEVSDTKVLTNSCILAHRLI